MTYPAPDKIEYDPWFDDKVEPSTLLKRTKEHKLSKRVENLLDKM